MNGIAVHILIASTKIIIYCYAKINGCNAGLHVLINVKYRCYAWNEQKLYKNALACAFEYTCWPIKQKTTKVIMPIENY